MFLLVVITLSPNGTCLTCILCTHANSRCSNCWNQRVKSTWGRRVHCLYNCWCHLVFTYFGILLRWYLYWNSGSLCNGPLFTSLSAYLAAKTKRILHNWSVWDVSYHSGTLWPAWAAALKTIFFLHPLKSLNLCLCNFTRSAHVTAVHCFVNE